MSVVDVYFDQEIMYNLEDMSRLGHLPKQGPEMLGKYLCAMKEEYTIKIAMMGFNHPLRNAIYTVFPNATVIIDPLEVEKMISHYLEGDRISQEARDEIAAGIEGSPGIYSLNTKQEAAFYYKQWQANVPLGIKSFHHVIRTIDYYYEEIFNYFEFKEVL